MPTRGPSQVRVSGPLAPYADGFRAALDAQGFSPWSQMFYLLLLAVVSRWLGRHGLDASGLTDANASEFRQDRRSRGLARFRGTQGLALLLSFLRNAGAAPPPTAAARPGRSRPAPKLRTSPRCPAGPRPGWPGCSWPSRT